MEELDAGGNVLTAHGFPAQWILRLLAQPFPHVRLLTNMSHLMECMESEATPRSTVRIPTYNSINTQFTNRPILKASFDNLIFTFFYKN